VRAHQLIPHRDVRILGSRDAAANSVAPLTAAALNSLVLGRVALAYFIESVDTPPSLKLLALRLSPPSENGSSTLRDPAAGTCPVPFCNRGIAWTVVVPGGDLLALRRIDDLR